MSGARKLQTEIDRVMKKIDEGVELFDDIWEKVYSAEHQNQKEKYEVDLKKEIKKLQRLRDQIKTWISSSDVKDKDGLIDARKLIETKMEQFKKCEKETKTKTYSKEGLAREDRLSPEEQSKLDTCAWIAEVIEKLQQLVEDRDVEIERLSAGKGKKSNKHLIDAFNQFIANHKFHINKLEGIMRLVNNDRLTAESVDELKDDLEYYVEAYEGEEYSQTYDEDLFYESLGLEDMDIVNVDRVTQAPSVVKKENGADDLSSTSSSIKDKNKSKKPAGGANVIPLTIGRARVTSTGTVAKPEPVKDIPTPTKIGRSNSTVSVGSTGLGPLPAGPAPTIRPPPTTPNTGGASMAAILKRESEQQEKEKQKQAALVQAQQQQEQQARAQAEQLRQQQLQKQQQEQLQRQQEVLKQQQAARQQAQQEAHQRQQQQLQEQQRQQLAAQQEAATKQQQLLAQKQAAQQKLAAQQQLQAQQQRAPQQSSSGSQGGSLDSLLNSGLGGLSLGNADAGSVNGSLATTITPQQQQLQGIANSSATVTKNFDATASYLGALNESFLHCPSSVDSERQRTYTPRNPYPTPSSYPSTPSPIFDNPVVFEKLGTDCLFFIFYYAQGTYQQYLAARELKKQSWRYHKKYMTWFQRHEEPKVTTDEYEQGTYVYFDYETGWCQRIKSDFRFEYSFLEDSLSI